MIVYGFSAHNRALSHSHGWCTFQSRSQTGRYLPISISNIGLESASDILDPRRYNQHSPFLSLTFSPPAADRGCRPESPWTCPQTLPQWCSGGLTGLYNILLMLLRRPTFPSVLAVSELQYWLLDSTKNDFANYYPLVVIAQPTDRRTLSHRSWLLSRHGCFGSCKSVWMRTHACTFWVKLKTKQ